MMDGHQELGLGYIHGPRSGTGCSVCTAYPPDLSRSHTTTQGFSTLFLMEAVKLHKVCFKHPDNLSKAFRLVMTWVYTRDSERDCVLCVHCLPLICTAVIPLTTHGFSTLSDGTCQVAQSMLQKYRQCVKSISSNYHTRFTAASVALHTACIRSRILSTFPVTSNGHIICFRNPKNTSNDFALVITFVSR